MSIFGLFVLCAAAFAESAGWDSLLSEAGQLQQKGSYADAQKRLEDALSQAELFGPRDTRLAMTLNNLGILLRIQGKYQLAERHGTRALEIWTEINGPVTIALNSLAVLFADQGRYREAEANYRKAIRIEERKNGPS